MSRGENCASVPSLFSLLSPVQSRNTYGPKNDMNPREFFINPADYGLPTRDELVAYRIWDNHFHGFAAKNPVEQYERNNFFVERMGIERSIAQEVGGPSGNTVASSPADARILRHD